MRYSFLDLLVCPYTHEPLVVVAGKERDIFIPAPYIDVAQRVSCPGSVVGCLPSNFVPGNNFSKQLSALSSPPGDSARNEQVVVWDGLLVAPNSCRWYPIIEGIPEILPDSLRNWERDQYFLETLCANLPLEIYRVLKNSITIADRIPKSGDNYKTSEITLLDKVESVDSFVGPGLYSPFNPYAFFHSSELIRGFSICIPFLGLSQGSYVLDSGSGYSWTTEWFMKMGIRAVGVEINRTYLDVGRKRMGSNQPHLIVADVENLPFSKRVFDAVLGFDAFHHIPDRPKAMKQFARVLKDSGRVVLVEPGGAHEHHQVSQDVMKKYGTLEVGMELADVQNYIEGINEFGPAKETFIFPVHSSDDRDAIPATIVKDRSFLGWCLYSVAKSHQES
jgi:ubiquinone/menaquinone biosynthesis C-methylase UbiE/uncharacterized protein YbaR (Trm112 family)